MSFDVFLTSFRNGVSAAADSVAANAFLDRHTYRHDRRAYVVKFEDESQVELFASGLDGKGDKPFTGGMFALRGMTDSIGTFIVGFSRAAGCVIIPAMEPPCILLPREDLAAQLPNDLTEKMDQIIVIDGSELIAALKGGHAAWQAYRDQVVRKAGGGPEGGT
jgi:hypothetical protein